VASAHYTVDQVRAWAPDVPPASLIDGWAADGRVLLVAEDESGPIAFGDLEINGHLDHLFCRPDRARQGVTAKLYAALEESARVRAIKLIFVEASEPARRFFLRQGFLEEYRRDFNVRGVPIHNFRMVKRLEQQATHQSAFQ
jgi:putative acetyltransferase